MRETLEAGIGGAGYNPATYFYYDGWNLVQEGKSASTAARLYMQRGPVDEIVARQTRGEWHYHHYDARGNCTLLTDTNSMIREQYDYDAFGLPFLQGCQSQTRRLPVGNRSLFTGRDWLQDL